MSETEISKKLIAALRKANCMVIKVHGHAMQVSGWPDFFLALPPSVPGTGNRTQETGTRAQETGMRTQETGNRTQETGTRTQETGNRTQETGNRTPETGNRTQETGTIRSAWIETKGPSTPVSLLQKSVIRKLNERMVPALILRFNSVTDWQFEFDPEYGHVAKLTYGFTVRNYPDGAQKVIAAVSQCASASLGYLVT